MTSVSKPALDLQLIFARALEFDSPIERARYLAEVCADDPVLRDEIESLLRAHAVTGEFLEDPVFSTMILEGPPRADAASSVIGPYKLLQQIGEGGMGVVYLAEQTHPLCRRVAMKIIKPGMSSRLAIARFEAERQALAIMEHPNIAKVFDAGATATGQPYFVMELVTGVPITEYCDQAQLTPRERLALLVPVCLAIQHAHQKGIIHRDIKPSNVLVALYDGVPVPKVIDFGVAKAIDQRLTAQTLFTHQGTIVGTLEYMSPEQAENSALDIDTRTDVYALGVLLYELLTGTTPLERHRLRQVGYTEILRRIREEESPKLSTRLSKTEQIAEIAARRNMEPAKLAKLVRGELDWIAMKALEKERNRRYATANDLARDLRRYLADEPLDAGPPSAIYRMRKFARKHRAPLATAVAFAAVLVAATAVSTWQAIRATRSENESKTVLGFFNRMLAATRPRGRALGFGRQVSLREAVDAAEPTITFDFGGQPKVEAAVRNTVGVMYGYLGEPSLAIRQYEQAMQLRIRELGPDHVETLTSMNDLAVAYQATGRIADAIPLHKRAFAIFKAKLGRSHADTLGTMNNLATDYQLAGRFDEAIALFEEGLAVRKATLGPDHTDTLNSTNYLGVAYYTAGRIAEALSLLEQALKGFRATLGPDHLDTLTAMNNLASTYLEVDQANDAVLLLEETLSLRGVKQGPDHPDTLNAMNNLAAAYLIVGRIVEAAPLFEEVLALRRAKLGHDHPDTLKTLHNLATSYRETGKTIQAIPLFEQAVALRKAKLKTDHPDTLASMNSLAAAYLEMQQWAKAEGLLRECLTLRETKQPDNWLRFHTMSQLGASLAGLGKYAKAEPFLIDGYEGLKAREAKIPGRFKKDLSAAASRIVPFYQKWGNPKMAGTWRLKLAPPSSPPQPKLLMRPRLAHFLLGENRCKTNDDPRWSSSARVSGG